MGKADWFAVITGLITLGGGLYLGTFHSGFIRRSGITLMALGAVGLIVWFGYYRDTAEAQQCNGGIVVGPNAEGSIQGNLVQGCVNGITRGKDSKGNICYNAVSSSLLSADELKVIVEFLKTHRRCETAAPSQ
jgi:hypothetical protein